MSSDTFNVLVTGTNGGLGLGICLRLIDDFLKIQEPTQKLNLIFTTRSARKSSDTLKTLQSHLHKTHDRSQHPRVTFQGENVDLLSLLSVRDLARKLLESNLNSLDAIICNAGIGGWSGMDWFRAVPDVLLDLRNNTTWPEFKLGTAGALTKPQLSSSSSKRGDQQSVGQDSEPPLGEIFCANVFGHYMLIHWLMPLFRACPDDKPGKIIWVSSIEPQDYHFRESDLQGLTTTSPYESGKRLTDLLSLTSNLPSSAKAYESFTALPDTVSRSNSKGRSTSVSSGSASRLPRRPNNGPPSMHVYHPGILCTTVFPLPPIIHQAYMSAIYAARFIGANWSNVNAYPAAHTVTWLTFASESDIQKAEREVYGTGTNASDSVGKSLSLDSAVANGKVKWGTSSTPLGQTSIKPTEVSDWGLNGSGRPYAETWWGGTYGAGGRYGRGRKPDAKEAKGEDVRGFVELGGRVWGAMEQLREEWEGRIV